MLKRKNEAQKREIAENELHIQKLESKKKEDTLKQQASELEMQALRAQMNPHFIFNSLNSINRFILKKQSSEATEYLTKFSRLIRMILNSSASASVSLAEDLEALQLYLELESLRFDNQFSYKIECNPDVDTEFIHVPPMLLQPFVENAIWHGLMNKEGEGNLWININQEGSTLICTIIDDGIGRQRAAELKSKSSKHKSMGMNITESRIAMLQRMNENKPVEIKDLVDADGSAAGTEVIIKIPVVYD
jgi:LytS/YehU family sensor histidine kinase